MPKISSYPKDIDILDADAWIGTDSSNRSTKQFTAQAVADYLNINGKVLIGGQMVYKFITTSPVTTGTIGGYRFYVTTDIQAGGGGSSADYELLT